ncbi:MAG: hypothetical protein FD176_3473 [Rhodospirillaceae bacterium]|nr:MAG: hypothetical protein FD176_3473 [Rhodospirillaceae bacterium]TNC98126.1 MAG: Uncharacterized protein FD119_609 [Stygiobacter sp.]
MADISSLLQTQYSLYSYNSDNALLRVKVAQADRLKKEYERIEDKYDGSAQADYEAKLEAAVNAKAEIATPYQRVQTALGKMDDLRNKLIEMRNAADLGSAEAFDYAYSTLTTMVGSSWLDNSLLTANNRTNSNTWPDRPELFSAGSYQIELKHYFLGNDYSIEMDDGSGTVRPEFSENTLSGGTVGGTKFEDISNVTITGDQISFDVGGTTHTGTLHKGGGGVLSAWGYNNFATATDQDAAKAAIDDAIERVRMAETQWSIAEAQLGGALSKLGLAQDQAQSDFEVKSVEIIEAKTAEKKAAKARFDLSVNSLALTSNQATNYIQQMFMAQPIGQSKGIFDIIGGY